ncbi:MAG TPA: Fn3-like domain-containing protein, partial [Thermoanaerobaculia bacterium]|nr:Fn3-like domain-containing protein [Thermoanaerobaculia bacterium]
LHAGNGALTVTPAVVQLRGSFGQSTTQRMTITNGTSQPMTFALAAEDVVVKNGTRVFVAAGETTGSIAATAVFSSRSVTVQPGATEAVNVTLTIPRTATSRAVVARFRGTTRNHVSAAIGALFTFTLGNDITVDTDALQVRPQTTASNLRIAQKCTNRGSDPVVARAVAAVVDGGGKLIGRTAIPPRRLLPGETTTITGEFTGDLAPGDYRVLITYDFEGRKTLTSAAETSVR